MLLDQSEGLTTQPKIAFSDAPARLIGRIASEFLQDVAMATRRTIPESFRGAGGLDRLILFLALLRYAPSPMIAWSVPPRMLRVTGVAASLGMPYESARRFVGNLADEGLVTRDAAGVRVNADWLASAAMTRLATVLHDLMVGQIADLQALGLAFPAARERPYQPERTIAAALDVFLFLCERARTAYGDALSGILLNAIVVANVRPIAFDPVLARQYARIDTIPPDHLRRPVPMPALARALDLPYSTVARTIRTLIGRGIVEACANGLVVPREQLARSMLTDHNRIALHRALQVVQSLRDGGFRFDRPDANLIGVRPPRIAYD